MGNPQLLIVIAILYCVLFFLGLFLVPSAYVARTGKFWKGVILTWVLWVVFSWIHVCMYPSLVNLSFLIYDEYPETGGEAFFGAIAMFVLGWIPGLFVSGFGMLLRDSEYKGDLTYASVLALAKSSQGADKFGYRREFIELVDLAKSMSPRQ